MAAIPAAPAAMHCELEHLLLRPGRRR